MKTNPFKNIKGVGLATTYSIKSLLGINLKKQSQFIISSNGLLYVKKHLRIKKTASLLNLLIKKKILNQITIKSYRGLRHKNNYPVHGQRTHTNAKTQRKLSSMRLN